MSIREWCKKYLGFDFKRKNSSIPNPMDYIPCVVAVHSPEGVEEFYTYWVQVNEGHLSVYFYETFDDLKEHREKPDWGTADLTNLPSGICINFYSPGNWYAAKERYGYLEGDEPAKREQNA